MWTLPPPAASVIETIQPPQPLLGLLTPKIVVPVLEEALLAEAVALPFPVTYMIPPPVVDLVMEAEISDHQGPRQTDMKTHLMEGSLEVRGHTEVKQRLKGKIYFYNYIKSFDFTKKCFIFFLLN